MENIESKLKDAEWIQSWHLDQSALHKGSSSILYEECRKTRIKRKMEEERIEKEEWMRPAPEVWEERKEQSWRKPERQSIGFLTSSPLLFSSLAYPAHSPVPGSLPLILVFLKAIALSYIFCSLLHIRIPGNRKREDWGKRAEKLNWHDM